MTSSRSSSCRPRSAAAPPGSRRLAADPGREHPQVLRRRRACRRRSRPLAGAGDARPAAVDRQRPVPARPRVATPRPCGADDLHVARRAAERGRRRRLGWTPFGGAVRRRRRTTVRRRRGRDAALRRDCRAGGDSSICSRSSERMPAYTIDRRRDHRDRDGRPRRRPAIRGAASLRLAQHVADAAHRVDQRARAGVLELAPQVADVDAQRVRGRAEVVAPDAVVDQAVRAAPGAG